jgi:hypothetical protein
MIKEPHPSIKQPHSYQADLTKDALDYLNSFTEKVKLNGTWAKTPEVKECYLWCEKHLGVKYRDWYLLGSTLHFKDSKNATMFRLTWSELIA